MEIVRDVHADLLLIKAGEKPRHSYLAASYKPKLRQLPLFPEDAANG